MNGKNPEVAKIIDNYLKRLKESLQDIPKEEAQDIIDEIIVHIEDSTRFDSDSVEAVRAVLKDIGEPEEYAQNLKEEGYFTTKSNHQFKLKSSGRILGMPYNFGRPTLKKIAERMWEPSDPRVLRPKAFGVGWAINFGALAVKLRLLRPDDEEGVPFSNVPDRALSIGMLLSILLNIGVIIIAIIYFKRLPAKVPIHFGFAEPDQFASPLKATLWWIGIPSSATVILYLFVFLRKKSRLARALSAAFILSFSVLSDGAYIDSIYYALNGRLAIHPSLLVFALFAIFFITLTTFSKLGLKEEWRKNKVIGIRNPNSKEVS